MNKQYLQNNGFLVLSIFVVSLLLFYFIGDSLYQPSRTETIELFISSNYLDSDYFYEKLEKVDDIKKINVISRSITNSYYESFFQTVGLSSDLLIIPKRHLEDESCKSTFREIDLEYLASLGLATSSLQTINFNNKCYGIVVFDQSNNLHLFKDHISYETTDIYVLCISINSPNAYASPKGNKQSDKAFQAIYELLK